VDYKRVNISVATAAMKVCMRHLWYICETLVGLAFFDDEVDAVSMVLLFKVLERNFSGRK